MSRYQCDNCDGPLHRAHDPGDDFAEVWCPDERDCEHPGCLHRGCGDDRPRACDHCGLNFCAKHLSRLADLEVCSECDNAMEAAWQRSMESPVTSPGDLVHTMREAMKLK